MPDKKGSATSTEQSPTGQLKESPTAVVFSCYSRRINTATFARLVCPCFKFFQMSITAMEKESKTISHGQFITVVFVLSSNIRILLLHLEDANS